MQCPKCGGEMWDNTYSKTNPKAPDHKCKNKACNHAIWMPGGNNQGASRNFQAPGPKKDVQKSITIGQSWNLAVASMSDGAKINLDFAEVERRAKEFFVRVMAWQKPKPAAQPPEPPQPPPPDVAPFDCPPEQVPAAQLGQMPPAPEDDLPF